MAVLVCLLIYALIDGAVRYAEIVTPCRFSPAMHSQAGLSRFLRNLAFTAGPASRHCVRHAL